ncbi:hypothetical protein N7481_013112 [Penicillium waksmanii]|uniref:uncharacterized protein n=1 Tax=Penicillium waksmanii TaxID=69791 RepID=UPI0025485CF3|nr:uncharacterized protein N7481_013112 [Penicillium waksmanii]KAJ5966398.1 hypothetical protein N7481_013112 [Penicillium waksmanii]
MANQESAETPGAFPTLDSLLFPSAQTSISQTLASLRRSALSVSNRLKSIETDAEFVREVAEHYGLPLVANERCGSWYIDPETKSGSAYFKSTDGHSGQWDFSFRRLNLQLLPLARENGGCVIVDSTRRGKLMPDALSKTIPIWAAVVNRTLFPTETAYHPVHLPPNYLGASEEAQIKSRIDSFVASLKLDLNHLREQLGKPIRIAWANRSYFHPTDLHKGDGYNLLVLCSASRRVQGAEMSEGGYIQGAGDDAEGWAHGLTPPVFWEHRARLKGTSEEELPALIGELIASSGPGQGEGQGQGNVARIAPTRNLFIGVSSGGMGEAGSYDLVIDCNDNGTGEGEEGGSKPSCKKLNLGCASGKLGSRDLRKSLDRVREFVAREFAEDSSRSLLVTCENGKDLSAGTLLAIICLFYNDQGEFDISQGERSVGKQYIRQRLAWIVSSKHDVNPSRSTLQSVNAFLMS